jgi:hypothetical protein
MANCEKNGHMIPQPVKRKEHIKPKQSVYVPKTKDYDQKAILKEEKVIILPSKIEFWLEG